MNIIELSFSLININININIDEKYKIILTIIFVFIFIHSYISFINIMNNKNKIINLIYNYFYGYYKFIMSSIIYKSKINNLNIYKDLDYSNKKVKTNQIEPKQPKINNINKEIKTKNSNNNQRINNYYYINDNDYIILPINPTIEDIQRAMRILENHRQYITNRTYMRENNRLNEIYDTLLKK